MTAWKRLSDDEVRALAPNAIDAFRSLIGAVTSAYDPVRLELLRRRIAMLLSLPHDVLPALAELPAAQLADLAAWPTSPAFTATDRTMLEFSEQFVMDVAGLSTSDRQRLGEALGDATFPVVQAIYVLDHVARLSAVVRQVFGTSPLAAGLPTEPLELWPAMEDMMTAVITIRGLDPLTAELVRLRGARLHHCRVCQSRRRVAAVVEDAALLENPQPADNADLESHQRAALLLTDAILLNPSRLPAAVIQDVITHLTPERALEVAMLVAHNAANKIAVALGADAPSVAQGIEFFEVDSAGNYAYGLPLPP